MESNFCALRKSACGIYEHSVASISFAQASPHGTFLPQPEYTDNAFMLNVTIRNDKENGEDGEVNGEVNFDEFTKNEQLVYEAILSNADITRADLIEMLDISARTIDRAIKSLKEKNAIERVGSDKTGHWKINR